MTQAQVGIHSTVLEEAALVYNTVLKGLARCTQRWWTVTISVLSKAIATIMSLLIFYSTIWAGVHAAACPCWQAPAAAGSL